MRATLRGLSAALALAGVVALTSDALAQEVMYASTAGGRSATAGTFGDVDQVTGQYTQIGDPTAMGPLPAIAINSLGQVFGSNNTDGNRDTRVGILIQLSPSTGQLVNTVGTITDTSDATELRVSSMAFQPGTDVLYALASIPSKRGLLYTVDTSTAAATLVGDTGLDRGGIAFGPDGTLYLATARISPDPLLARIDPSSGAVIGAPIVLQQEVEGIAVRPSDGVMFGVEADGSDVHTIDTTTGEMTFIARDGSSSGHVADLAFVPGAVNATRIEGFLAPEKIALKLNARTPSRSSIKLKARLDECCADVDYTQPLTVTLNGTTWDIPGLSGNAKGTSFKFANDEVKVVLRPRQRNSSRGLLSLSIRRDLTGIVTEGGNVTLRLAAGALDVEATAPLSGRKYRRGKSGAFDGPPIFPLAAKIKVSDPDRSAARLVFALNGIDGPPGDVLVGLGSFSQSIPADVFGGSETRPRATLRDPGVRSVRIDYRRGTVDISISKATIGYDRGDLILRLDIGGERVETVITPRGKNGKFGY